MTTVERSVEITSVANDEVVLFEGAERRVRDSLTPNTEYEFDGVWVRTLDAPGELLCRFATINDVHFGESEAGKTDDPLVGPILSVPEGSDPYPEFMNAGAVAEIAAIDPAVVVVKGDLTAEGTDEEYRRFLEVYHGAFGERLFHVRGNHDAYPGRSFADWPYQRIDLEGLTIALLDTARLFHINGAVSSEQLDWLDTVAAEADRPVLVLGHHHIWNPDRDLRSDRFFGIKPVDSEGLISVIERRRRIIGYSAGHTHRNGSQTIGRTGDVRYVEVACVKDFPGTWAEYRVFEGGVMQIHRRISTPQALAWSEQARAMYGGFYETYAFGDLDDRCFVMGQR